MININSIFGKPKDWKLTEDEIVDFISGIEDEGQLANLFKRLIEKDVYSKDMKDLYNPDTWKSSGEWDNYKIEYTYKPNTDKKQDTSDEYIEFLGKISEDKGSKPSKKEEESIGDEDYVWKKLHPLDKRQIFKDSPEEFNNFIEKLNEDDYDYYVGRIIEGKRLLSFNSMQKVRADKVAIAFDELLKIISDDVVRVSVQEPEKNIVLSSTNIDRLEALREKLQSFGGVFGECEYDYKTRNMITVHYYIFKKL